MTGPELYEILWHAKATRGVPTPLKGYATVCQPLTLHEYVSTSSGALAWANGRPVTQTIDLPPGAIVKIVMVSRLGDFGITSHLEREHGYDLRVLPEDARLTDWRLGPAASGGATA